MPLAPERVIVCRPLQKPFQQPVINASIKATFMWQGSENNEWPINPEYNYFWVIYFGGQTLGWDYQVKHWSGYTGMIFIFIPLIHSAAVPFPLVTFGCICTTENGTEPGKLDSIVGDLVFGGKRG